MKKNELMLRFRICFSPLLLTSLYIEYSIKGKKMFAPLVACEIALSTLIHLLMELEKTRPLKNLGKALLQKRIRLTNEFVERSVDAWS